MAHVTKREHETGFLGGRMRLWAENSGCRGADRAVESSGFRLGVEKHRLKSLISLKSPCPAPGPEAKPGSHGFGGRRDQAGKIVASHWNPWNRTGGIERARPSRPSPRPSRRLLPAQRRGDGRSAGDLAEVGGRGHDVADLAQQFQAVVAFGWHVGV